MDKTLRRFLVIITVSGLLLVAVVVCTFLYCFPKGYVPNQIDGMKWSSKSIMESKEKGLLIEELYFEIKPDTFKLKRETKFFIEKTHIYDGDSPNLVKIQCDENNSCYQINQDPEAFMFEDDIIVSRFKPFDRFGDTLNIDLLKVYPNGENFERKKAN